MHWYQSGMALEIISQLLGHAQTSTTRIYAWADVEMKRQAIEKADGLTKTVPQSNHESFDWTNENLLNRLCGLRGVIMIKLPSKPQLWGFEGYCHDYFKFMITERGEAREGTPLLDLRRMVALV